MISTYKNHRIIGIFIILWILTFSAGSQHLSPKRELRGVWISTVTNIDWPSDRNLSSDQQKSEFIAKLDLLQELGFNAVFVQIRPSADAFYKSNTEPWSYYLTGKHGVAPEPYYDPLEFMLLECHKRDIEFHAWLNPYRITNAGTTRYLHETSVAKKHPDWLLKYGNLIILDPGKPKVRNYLKDVVVEIATNYEVDGIHFDDYFYPYPVDSLRLNDQESFAAYNPKKLKLNDWRRENVNQLIESLHDTLSVINTRIKFGISPFGIWRNNDWDPNGSDTRGLSGYDEIYADARKWLQEGWIDYVTPQIYWSHNFKKARFDKLVDWWGNNNFGRPVFVGHAAYKVNKDDDTRWSNKNEIPNQIKTVRQNRNTKGSVFFSMKVLEKNPNGITDSIRKYYAKPALRPIMPWKDSILPERPRALKIKEKRKGNLITWKSAPPAPDDDLAIGYMVYRFTDTAHANTNDPNALLAKIPGNQLKFLDQNRDKNKRYKYYVTALDRNHNESLLPFVLSTSYIKTTPYLVTLKSNTARVHESAPLLVSHGRIKVLLDSIPKNIVENSLKISMKGEISSIEYIDYPMDTSKIESVLNKYLAEGSRLKKELAAMEDSLEVISETIATLRLNRAFVRAKDTTINAKDIKEYIEYFQQKMAALKRNETKLEFRFKNKLDEVDALSRKIEAIQNKNVPAYMKILITGELQKTPEYYHDIRVEYDLKGVEWEMDYDFEFKDSESGCSITPNVTITNRTSEDWNDVHIALDDGNNGKLRWFEAFSIGKNQQKRLSYGPTYRNIEYVYSINPTFDYRSTKIANMDYLQNFPKTQNKFKHRIFIENNYVAGRETKSGSTYHPLTKSIILEKNSEVIGLLNLSKKENWRSRFFGWKSNYYMVYLENQTNETANIEVEVPMPKEYNNENYRFRFHKYKTWKGQDNSMLKWDKKVALNSSLNYMYGYSFRKKRNKQKTN